ncbi:MAG: SDR family oxidoreductase [Rhodanobacter sp.]|jgi:short-subunit dehydrogenase|nr:SDR family oxidoreductase [Rhodanobacter sp.]
MNISGAKVLLTGASGGIGSAIAHELTVRGAELILVGRDAAKLERLATELKGHGARSTQELVADIGDPDAAQRLVAEALQRSGGIDILINCAGVQNFGFFANESAQDMATLLHVNTIAPLILTNAVLPHMLANRRGQIVNVGSIFGSIGFPYFASYSASKFALRGFSEALRRELTGTGIGVTYVAPRFTKTAFNGDAVKRMADALKMNQDDPQTVAASVIAAIQADGHNRYLGWPEKFFVRINSLLPRLVDGSLKKQADQMRPFATPQGE